MSKRRSMRMTCAFAVALVSVAFLATQASAAGSPKLFSNSHELGTGHIPAAIWGEFKLSSQALGEGPEGEIHCQNVMAANVWNENGIGVGAIEGWGTNACKAPELELALTEIYEQPIKEKKIKGPITVFATAELPLEREFRQGIVCKNENEHKLKECEGAEERETTQVLWHIRRAVSSFPWKFELLRTKREGETAVVAKIGLPPAGQTCYPKEEVTNEEGNKEVVPAKWEKVPAGCVKITVIAPQVPTELVFYGTLEPRFVSGTGNGLDPSHFEFNKEAGTLIASAEEAPVTTSSGALKIAGSESEQLIYAK